jgi:hypothetical protein
MQYPRAALSRRLALLGLSRLVNCSGLLCGFRTTADGRSQNEFNSAARGTTIHQPHQVSLKARVLFRAKFSAKRH